MASVFLEGGDQRNFGPGSLNQSLATGSQMKMADAIIEGEFNAEASNGCFGPKFSINARNIQLVSPVEDFVPAD